MAVAEPMPTAKARMASAAVARARDHDSRACRRMASTQASYSAFAKAMADKPPSPRLWRTSRLRQGYGGQAAFARPTAGIGGDDRGASGSGCAGQQAQRGHRHTARRVLWIAAGVLPDQNVVIVDDG